MKQEYVVRNRLGIHVKPAKLIAQAAEQFRCDITLSVREKAGNAKSMIEILKLGVKCGDTVLMDAAGPDEVEAHRVVGGMLTQGLEAAGQAAKGPFN